LLYRTANAGLGFNSDCNLILQENDYTSGKWMIRVGWPEADAIWGMMVEALVGNKFPDELGILFIRVLISFIYVHLG
jgi:hypothetical protein